MNVARLLKRKIFDMKTGSEGYKPLLWMMHALFKTASLYHFSLQVALSLKGK